MKRRAHKPVKHAHNFTAHAHHAPAALPQIFLPPSAPSATGSSKDSCLGKRDWYECQANVSGTLDLGGDGWHTRVPSRSPRHQKRASRTRDTDDDEDGARNVTDCDCVKAKVR